MIFVTPLDASRIAVNPNYVVEIHADSGTTLVMFDGSSLAICETTDQVISMIEASQIGGTAFAPSDRRARSTNRNHDHAARIWDIDEITGGQGERVQLPEAE